MGTRTLFLVTLILWGFLPARAQFGGRPGDVVFYMVTAGGSAEFQTAPASANNSSQSLAAFKITSLDSIPKLTSEPFPLMRQIFYTTPTETFAVGSYAENTYGDHRLFTLPVKLLVIGGRLHVIGNIFGSLNTFIYFPRDLDVEGDVVVEEEVVAAWFAGQWPFEIETNARGSLGSPEEPGFLYLFQNPDLAKFPALMPWLSLARQYPGAGWEAGIDWKPLDIDSTTGTTIRQFRLRPGTRTPSFRIPGHTHLFVLQGSATITPAGGSSMKMKQHDYAFLGENFVVSLENPRTYGLSPQ